MLTRDDANKISIGFLPQCDLYKQRLFDYAFDPRPCPN